MKKQNIKKGVNVWIVFFWWIVLGVLIGVLVTIIIDRIIWKQHSLYGELKIHTRPDKDLFELKVNNIDDIYEKDQIILRITNDLEDASK